MKTELYQWQEACLKRWFANHCRGMVQAVTGSGKTLLALTGAKRLEQMQSQPLLVKIVVPTGALMHQWEQALRIFLGESSGTNSASNESIGLRGNGRKSSVHCKYMIYVINSARYELARQILNDLHRGEPVLLIADECHHYASGQNQLIFEFLPFIREHEELKSYEERFFSLGLTATLPVGHEQRFLSSCLGRKIYSYGIKEASLGQTISQFDIFHIKLPLQAEETEEYEEITARMNILYFRLLHLEPSLRYMNQKERYDTLKRLSGSKNRKLAEQAALYMNLSYHRKSLVCLASARIPCTLHLIERLDLSEKILIFGERISQAEKLYQLLHRQYPGRIGRYHSKMGSLANKNVLERFRTGELRILITCKAMDEGVDIPDVSIGIILSGTSTKRQHIQRLGRIIRKNPDKSRASLYYLHVEETSEDSCFLPDVPNHRILELEYFPDSSFFCNSSYEKVAKQLLHQMQNAGYLEETLQEVRRCIDLGSVRLDWTLESDQIQKLIDHAKYASQRNYWICMKKLKMLQNDFSEQTTKKSFLPDKK